MALQTILLRGIVYDVACEAETSRGLCKMDHHQLGCLPGGPPKHQTHLIHTSASSSHHLHAAPTFQPSTSDWGPHLQSWIVQSWRRFSITCRNMLSRVRMFRRLCLRHWAFQTPSNLHSCGGYWAWSLSPLGEVGAGTGWRRSSCPESHTAATVDGVVKASDSTHT